MGLDPNDSQKQTPTLPTQGHSQRITKPKATESIDGDGEEKFRSMAPKQPEVIENPPVASSSEEEEEESGSSGGESDSSGEEDSKKDDSSDEDEAVKPTQAPVATKKVAEAESESESESDSDPEPAKKKSQNTGPISTSKATKSSVPESSTSKRSMKQSEDASKKKMKTSEEEGKKKVSGDETKQMRIFSETDEINLLQGILDFTSTRAWEIDGFCDYVKELISFNANRSQLVTKIQRLKKRFANTVKNALKKGKSEEEIVFSKYLDGKIFDLSRKIWGNNGVLESKFRRKLEGKPIDDDKEKKKEMRSGVSDPDSLEKRQKEKEKKMKKKRKKEYAEEDKEKRQKKKKKPGEEEKLEERQDEPEKRQKEKKKEEPEEESSGPEEWLNELRMPKGDSPVSQEWCYLSYFEDEYDERLLHANQIIVLNVKPSTSNKTVLAYFSEFNGKMTSQGVSEDGTRCFRITFENSAIAKEALNQRQGILLENQHVDISRPMRHEFGTFLVSGIKETTKEAIESDVKFKLRDFGFIARFYFPSETNLSFCYIYMVLFEEVDEDSVKHQSLQIRSCVMKSSFINEKDFIL